MPNRNQFNTKEEYNAWYRSYRQKYKEKFRAYNRKYNSAWRKKNGYATEIRAKNKFPEKTHARIVLRNALKRGLLKKTPCEKCGVTRVHGHHTDYSKPLQVKWLCALHHTEIHVQMKKIILST